MAWLSHLIIGVAKLTAALKPGRGAAMDFVAIDVETANADLGSICQVGAAVFSGGKLVASWSSLVDPETRFDGMNSAIHGLNADAIRGAPKFPLIHDELHRLLASKVVVSHSAFDRTSIRRALEKYSLPKIECRWLDSARVVRRAWPEFAQRGYGLANVAQVLGIDFKHHDAFEDARACGEILVRALIQSGSDIETWFERLAYKESHRIAREGNEAGPLSGETIVFTGPLSIPRTRAAALAAQAGSDVAARVTKKTTILVVGDQDIVQTGGCAISSKHQKAEALIRTGQAIRILSESDFQRLISWG